MDVATGGRLAGCLQPLSFPSWFGKVPVQQRSRRFRFSCQPLIVHERGMAFPRRRTLFFPKCSPARGLSQGETKEQHSRRGFVFYKKNPGRVYGFFRGLPSPVRCGCHTNCYIGEKGPMYW